MFVAKELGFCSSLQHCLANMALLKHTKSLKLKPSWAFEKPIRSQLIRCILASFSSCPHQNFCIIPLISLHRAIGSWKILILNVVGMAWITAFSRTSFPACERNLIFQLCKQFYTLSLILLKSLWSRFPHEHWKPKVFVIPVRGLETQ